MVSSSNCQELMDLDAAYFLSFTRAFALILELHCRFVANSLPRSVEYVSAFSCPLSLPTLCGPWGGMNFPLWLLSLSLTYPSLLEASRWFLAGVSGKDDVKSLSRPNLAFPAFWRLRHFWNSMLNWNLSDLGSKTIFLWILCSLTIFHRTWLHLCS